MEPVTLITTALAIVSPYLVKTGEKLAESAGEGIWEWIKKSFTKDEEQSVILNFDIENDSEKLKAILLKRITEDVEFKNGLEKIVDKAQNDMKAYQQNINNKGSIEKQINIQENTGNIQM